MDFRVKDFMSTDIKSISQDMNVRDAFKVLVENQMSGLPVTDQGGNLVGVFTEKEILKTILPVYVKDVGSFIYAEDSKAELKKIANLDKFLVKDVMRKEVPTIDENSSLTEASKIMLMKSERRVVVTREKKIVGVITRSDVVSGLAKKAGVVL